jgi:hypothetical protein
MIIYDNINVSILNFKWQEIHFDQSINALFELNKSNNLKLQTHIKNKSLFYYLIKINS